MTAFKAIGDVLLGSFGIIDGELKPIAIFFWPMWTLVIMISINYLLVKFGMI